MRDNVIIFEIFFISGRDLVSFSRGLLILFLSMRPWSFIMSLLVILISALYVLYLSYYVDLLLLTLIILGVLLLHGVANWLNDYFDYVKGVDRLETGTVMYRPHPLVENILIPNRLFLGSMLLFSLSLSIGLYISYVYNRWFIIPMGLLGFMIGFMYSGYPYMKHRALGEVLVFVAFGPLLTLGVFYALTGGLDARAFLIGVPLGFLISNVLFANNIRDMKTDLERSVRTLANLLGLEKSLVLYQVFYLLAYLSQIALVILGILPISTLATLLIIPRVIKLVKLFKQKIPSDADPRTAAILRDYALLMILGLVLGIVYRRIF